MMHCEEYLLQLNARHDGELSGPDAAALEAHLSECSHCRAASEGFDTIDAELRAAFAPRRVAALALTDRILAEVRAISESAPTPARPAPTSTPRFSRKFGELSLAEWGRTLLASAAGFLLAVALFRSPPGPQTTPGSVLTAATSGPPAGRMVLASGPVQMRAMDQTPFLGCEDGSPIKPASVLRTGDNARCELSLEGGNMIRLDRNTEITLHKPDRVEVNSGRLWAASRAAGKPIVIVSDGCDIEPKSAAEVAIERRAETVRLVVVNGAVHVATDKESKDLASGQQIDVADGKLTAVAEPNDPQLETAWMNGMLAGRAGNQPELRHRVQALLAQVGSANVSLLYEDELRRLGDGGVPPLVAYLESTRTAPQDSQRVVAAQIVADVAQPRRIGDLVVLLQDPSPEVRYHAARALERLTGRDQGLTAEAWKADSAAEREAAYQKWREWWTANSDKFAAVVHAIGGLAV